MSDTFVQPLATDWGARFVVEDADLEFIYNLLLEEETPLTTAEMARALTAHRFERESKAEQQRQQGTQMYYPREAYAVGQTLTFPALGFVTGVVQAVRPGHNHEQPDFDVIRVAFADGAEREFAARLSDHKLNHITYSTGELDAASPEALWEAHQASVISKLEARLRASPDIVRLAGRWFPRALLVNINEGYLNLAEAVLDMAGGGPLATADLLKEIGLPAAANARLQEFSLNFFLQEDERFDEVGPAGQVLWFLRRLEPAEILQQPARLANTIPAADTAGFPPVLQGLAHELVDEFTPAPPNPEPVDEVTLTLTYPHRRTGTLPLSYHLKPFFPTAHVTPRVRFTFVDADTGARFPGWVVRTHNYIYGLAEWYKQLDFPLGGLLTIRQGDQPGEVIIRAHKRRPVREWVRQVSVGSDNRLAFTMQKKQIGVNYDDLMMVAFDNLNAVDSVWQKYQDMPFHRLVADVFRELAKLNPQSAVHAKTLYAAVNVVRRCPPSALFTELVTRPYYVHVGDAYWRFDQTAWTESQS